MTKGVIFDEKKKIRSLFCAAALTLSLAACGSKTSDCSGQTITGEITDIDGTAVTMQLGELSAGGMPSHDVSDSSDSGQTLPDKLDGETQSGNSSSEDHASSDSGQPPAKPDSQSSSFTAGEESVTLDFANAEITKNDESIELSDQAEGDILTVEVGSSNTAASATVESVGGGQSFGGSGEVTQGTAATTICEDGTYSGESYTSTGDFYGMNAALLAMNGATVTIKNATVPSSAQNGNGVFSYGSGTTVNISDSTITTTADNSGGIQTTGGGTTSASNLVAETSGNSSAAIRSGRGGGTVNVSGGAHTSNGYNSPAVYSTADITVKNANLTANNSEALVIEGKNAITLEDCYVTGNMSDTKGTNSSENVHNVIIYQSMSGDADVGTSVFSMTGGSLVGSSGDMFYITNTHCLLTLSGVNIVNNDADGALLRVVGNSASRGWGTAGSNGAQVEFTADGQTLSSDIIVDTISTLTMTMKNGSTFTGTISIVDNAEGGTAVSDSAVVTIENGCTWNLTGNCTLTSLTNNGTINFNGYTITLADGTVLK